jgi:hypothetical protein
MSTKLTLSEFREEIARHFKELEQLIDRDGNMSICPEALVAVGTATGYLDIAFKKTAEQAQRQQEVAHG